MAQKSLKKELTVKKCEDWDILKGWVRINNISRQVDNRNVINRKNICKISLSRNGEEFFVYRSIMGENEKDIIRMDKDTRLALNVRTGDKHEFDLQKIEPLSDPFAHIYYYLYHPDRSIQVSSWLGGLSIVLALLGLLISALYVIF